MIELMDVPPLNDPVMVVAFEGWNDAGDVASSAVAPRGDTPRESEGEWRVARHTSTA